MVGLHNLYWYYGSQTYYVKKNGVDKLAHTSEAFQGYATAVVPLTLIDSLLARLNPLESRGNYSATSNNMKLAHWPLMGGLLHLVQLGGDWMGPQPAQTPPCCTKCNSPPINGQCTNHRIAV